MITKLQILNWLKKSADVLREKEAYLTELDSAIGDADHGTNMVRGFSAVLQKLPTVEDKDIGTILKTTGMTLMSSVGGASGPLYGTFFMRAGMAAESKESLDHQDLIQMLDGGLNGLVQRGRAEVGDKTMVDALTPALDALRLSLNGEQGMTMALQVCVSAAEEGMKATIPLQAKKGRASYLGERSIGHQDPGATSTFLVLNALFETVAQDST